MNYSNNMMREKNKVGWLGFFLGTVPAAWAAIAWYNGAEWVAVFLIVWCLLIIGQRQAKDLGY